MTYRSGPKCKEHLVVHINTLRSGPYISVRRGAWYALKSSGTTAVVGWPIACDPWRLSRYKRRGKITNLPFESSLLTPRSPQRRGRMAVTEKQGNNACRTAPRTAPQSEVGSPQHSKIQPKGHAVGTPIQERRA